MRHVWVFIENICTATCHSISVIFLLFGRRSPTILSLPPTMVQQKEREQDVSAMSRREEKEQEPSCCWLLMQFYAFVFIGSAIATIVLFPILFPTHLLWKYAHSM